MYRASVFVTCSSISMNLSSRLSNSGNFSKSAMNSSSVVHCCVSCVLCFWYSRRAL